MIAVDSSSLIAWFRGEDGPDLLLLDQALDRGLVVLPPVVVTEVLSDPALDEETVRVVRALSVQEVQPGFGSARPGFERSSWRWASGRGWQIP